jgi:hypothetical protein
MKTKLLFVLSALALVACSDVNSPTNPASKSLALRGALGDMLVNESVPVTLALVACNGEEVDVSGTERFMTAITTTPSGNTIARVTNDYSFSGVGLVTGAKYEGGAHFVDKEILNVGAATVFSIDMSERLIGQGNVPNTWVDISTAFTIDANGNVTHNASTYSTRCH